MTTIKIKNYGSLQHLAALNDSSYGWYVEKGLSLPKEIDFSLVSKYQDDVFACIDGWKPFDKIIGWLEFEAKAALEIPIKQKAEYFHKEAKKKIAFLKNLQNSKIKKIEIKVEDVIMPQRLGITRMEQETGLRLIKKRLSDRFYYTIK